MKLRHLMAVIALIVAIASCSQKKASLSEQLTGKWSGTNSVELTIVDSSGNTVIQVFDAPTEIEYLADSTFTAVVTVNENNIIKIGGEATFTDSTALLIGSLSWHNVMAITGSMKLNEEKVMNLNYITENPAEGVVHKGRVLATRVKE